ncbi:hypothetical protein NDU88_001514 [Pleurodeles waltl]|uniref:Uncharacterized protein n=1 Tax=Pleurodeles waltl TaxID=8319 RepID=A0AAV7V812_PLEWA|nr:hypothetical protein NDU88_001514 [Pleurodeles waltl]
MVSRECAGSPYREGDMDPDLLEEWRTQTAECSIKLMGTLIAQAKRRMDEQIIKTEQFTKKLEKMANQQEVSNQLAEMEEQIKNKEEEIKLRFSIADSTVLVVINDLARESDAYGYSYNDDTNINIKMLNEMGFSTDHYSSSRLKLSSKLILNYLVEI